MAGSDAVAAGLNLGHPGGAAAGGLCTAYALARWQFPGKQIVNSLVHLPLILPPVVTGYLLLMLFGTKGPVGGALQQIGIVFAFRWTGRGAGRGHHGLSADGAGDPPVGGGRGPQA